MATRAQTKASIQPYSQAEEPGSGADFWQRAVPTGSLALDLKLGTGGWPRGCIVEIYGPEGSGKTTLLLEAIAQAQKHGGMGAFIDADHGLRQATATRLGIDLERMPFARTNVLEDAFEKISELVQGGAVDVIALDSVAALMATGYTECSRDGLPPKQDELHLHYFEHFLKALLGPLSRSRAVLLISNQVRQKVNVFFGSPETTPWHTAPLRDFAAQRTQLARVGQVKDGEETVGAEVRAKIVKNRLANSFTQASFEIHFATGICKESELLGLGLEAGLLSKRGMYLYFGESPLARGQGEAIRLLQKDTELAGRLKEAILQRLKPEPVPSHDGDGGT
jgi:recombination protein RecA